HSAVSRLLRRLTAVRGPTAAVIGGRCARPASDGRCVVLCAARAGSAPAVVRRFVVCVLGFLSAGTGLRARTRPGACGAALVVCAGDAGGAGRQQAETRVRGRET